MLNAVVNYKLVGLSGKAGCGKDYLGSNYLRLQGYMPFSLAWHFKIWVAGKSEASYEDVFFNKPPEVRKLLQLEGTERGRNVYGENVWCNVAAYWLRLLNESWGTTNFYIPDVRFPNEVEFVQKLGGKVYRIIAPAREKNSGLTEQARQHISETALDSYIGFDGIIYNNPEDDAGAQLRQLLYRDKLDNNEY